MTNWSVRKIVFLLAIVFAILLLTFALQHFISRNQWLELVFQQYPAIIETVKQPENGWAYSATGAALVLIVAVFYLLLREVRIRRKIAYELKMQKEHYRITINSISEGLITTGKQGEIVYMNPAAEKLTGWLLEDALHLPLDKIYSTSEESGAPAEPIVARVLQYRLPATLENNTILHAKGGPALIVRNSAAPLFDAAGALSGAVLVFNDITSTRKTEIKLKESEEQYRTLIQHLPEAVYTCDAEGFINLCNKAAINLWGSEPVYGKEQWSGAWKIMGADGTVVPPAESPMAIAIKQQQRLYGREITIQRPDGSIRHVLTHPSPLFDTSGRLTGAVDMLIDITERKISEVQTLEAVERYDMLAKATSDTIWDWDFISNSMNYHSGITAMFGYKTDEIENIGAWWKENIHPDDLQLVLDAYQHAAGKTNATVQQEYRFRCADGSYKHVYDRAYIFYDAGRKPVRIIGSKQDITYKKEEEQRFAKAIIHAQEQERRYIGEELHDNVNQLLASSLLTLGMVNHFKTDPIKITEFTRLTKEHTMNALNEIRRLSHELVPATFDDNTLKDIFETLLADINLKKQFAISLQFDESVNKSIAQDIQINLYRILQEQVKNILKYSAASSIEIDVNLTGSMVRMRTFDNGVGFDIKKTKKGIGFNNMKKRVESFAGKFTLAAEPGKGCEIIVEIPHTNKKTA